VIRSEADPDAISTFDDGRRHSSEWDPVILSIGLSAHRRRGG